MASCAGMSCGGCFGRFLGGVYQVNHRLKKRTHLISDQTCRRPEPSHCRKCREKRRRGDSRPKVRRYIGHSGGSAAVSPLWRVQPTAWNWNQKNLHEKIAPICRTCKAPGIGTNPRNCKKAFPQPGAIRGKSNLTDDEPTPICNQLRVLPIDKVGPKRRSSEYQFADLGP